MKYPIQVFKANESNREEIIQFLLRYDDWTLFLLSNLQECGLSLSDFPNSGNFKVIKQSDCIVGIFCLAKRGTLLIQSDVGAESFEYVLEACLQENILLRGLIGEYDYCHELWEFLKKKGIITKETLTSREILYNIDLAQKDYPQQENARLLESLDYAQWRILREQYTQELGFPNSLDEQQIEYEYKQKVCQQSSWGFFLKGELVSIADLNAKAIDLGQVGGVYTLPKYRGKGCAKSILRQLIMDAKANHKLRKLIIFTGDSNFAAQKVYESLGAQRIGYLGLFFGD